jgi:hypothetical protein
LVCTTEDPRFGQLEPGLSNEDQKEVKLQYIRYLVGIKQTLAVTEVRPGDFFSFLILDYTI